ncbi:MAG TPA: GNAT family N-acetyltransferase [Candidatus Acidoferrum sp.]|nr:GNAT family N-acetyltransferase [Candidatus Acidoferrum sp.]
MAASVAQARFQLEVDLTVCPSRASQSLVDGSARVKVIAIESPADMQRAYAIRRRVFIEEQRVPEEIELDADDAHAFHAIAILDGVAIGCGRMLEHGGSEVKIGRMAVLPEFRKTGVGAHILRFLIERARTRGFRKAILHAQLTAEGFYLRQGFSPVGGVFDEAGIAHRKMEREL